MPIILILIVAGSLPLTLMLVGYLSHRGVRAGNPTHRTLRRAIVGHTLIFCIVYVGALFWGASLVMANDQEPLGAHPTAGPATARSDALSVGEGLGMLGVALATGLSVLGAGYAVGVVGAAALGAIAEKPELFGRTLVFIGLAEGLAIYGLIVSILILGRLG
jgi:V/A-type H+-transporting ATPase subunit K